MNTSLLPNATLRHRLVVSLVVAICGVAPVYGEALRAAEVDDEHKVYASDEAEGNGSAFATDQVEPSSRRKKPLRAPPSDSAPPVRIRIGAESPIAKPKVVEPLPDISESDNQSDTEDSESVTEDPDSMSDDASSTPSQEYDQPARETTPSETETEIEADPETEIEAVVLKGIQPGVSTASDVKRGWGEPKSTSTEDGMAQQVFDLPPFHQVTLYFNGRIVSTIVLELQEAFPAQSVAEEMELAGFVPASVADPAGKVLGWAFPERGVLFRFSDNQPGHVARIILEPITPEPFALRAEQRLDADCLAGLADCKQALLLDPQHSQAHWLKARMLTALGRSSEALLAVNEAVQIDPGNLEYRLTLVEAQDAVGEYALALEECQRLADRTDVDSWTSSRAHKMYGDLLAAQRRDYRQASEQHMQAIKLAQPLLRDKNPELARSARRLLIDANLAMAYDVAWGNWKNKQQVVGKWLEKATTLADEGVDVRKDELRFRIASQALAALVGLQGDVDPVEWCNATLSSGRTLLTAAENDSRRRQVEWQLGAALYDALQVHQLRGDQRQALRFGQLALDHLSAAVEGSEPTASQSYLLGRVNFRVGVIHAVNNQDHREAVVWFGMARPHVEALLATPLADGGRTGETLVSMAVSYWAIGDRNTALELSEQGLRLIDQAVRDGQASREALGVPTANVAFMRRSMREHGSEEATAQRGSSRRKYE